MPDAATPNPSFSPGLARPVAFERCAGWLHAGHSDTAVVLCGAQGFEALCTRQSLRILADALCAQGHDVLRFDYPGEGDSLDPDDGAEPAAHWVESIRAATDWLRRERQARTIILVGLRLGALLALEAARSAVKADALALIAPPASGTAYWRELKATARMLGTTKLGCTVSDEVTELCGFPHDKRMADGFARLKPATITACPADRILIAEAAERPCDAIFDILAATGAAMHRVAFDGCADMLAAPTTARPPMALFAEIARWIGPGNGRKDMEWRDVRRLSTADLTEERVQFGDGEALCGVLCRPGGRSGDDTPTVVMLNAGAISHVGWARMSVTHARALARAGIASLRMDLSGIGDSHWTPGGPRPLLYSRQHVADARAAMDHLEALGHSRFLLTGLCAGGYVALHAAHQDPRVAAVVPVNVDKFVWHDHYDIDVIEQELNQSSSAYAAQAFSSSAWKRILSGDVSAQRVVAILKLLAAKATARLIDPIGEAVGYERGLSADDRFIRSVFADLAGRGARVALVFADRDPGIDELDRHMGANARFLKGFDRISIDVVADADHEFTPQPARDALLALLLDAVHRPARMLAEAA